jgi:hypothetical protein
MNQKDRIHNFIKLISMEILEFIKEAKLSYKKNDGWVPQKDINKSLEINFIAVPKANKDQKATGWFFSIIARMLEDENLIEFRKVDGVSYYRSLK